MPATVEESLEAFGRNVGADLRLTVTAEGVATEEQLVHLRTVHCTEVRPLTDHPLRTAEAIQFEPPPEFGAVPKASRPLCIEQRQVCIERVLPCPEDITSIAPKDLANTIATVAGFTNDLFDGRSILGERQDSGNGLLTSQVTLVLQSFRAGQKLWMDRRCADRCTNRTYRFTDGAQESRARVLHKMPSSGNLDGAGQCL